jgi:hypothetical protein
MPTNTEIFEQLSWDGGVAPGSAIAIGLLLLLLAAASLWSERRALGAGRAAAFFGLRLVALSCALWMLAGPTRLHVTRQTTAQSIAMMVDGSASMDVVDASNTIASTRWTIAGDAELAELNSAQCDCLRVALGVALVDCERLHQYVGEHRNLKHIESAATSAKVNIDRARDRAERLVSSLQDAAAAERASGIATLLDGAVRTSMARFHETLRATSDPMVHDARAALLETIRDALASAAQRASVLGEDLAAVDAESLKSRVVDSETKSRRQKASQTLQAFEAVLDGEIASQLAVRRFRFDNLVTEVGRDLWMAALNASPARDAESVDSDAARQAAPSATTNLSSALSQIAEMANKGSLQFAIVLTDGMHTDLNAPPPLDVAAELSDVPLFIVPVGNATMLRDVVLHRVEAPAAVAEGDSAAIDVIVTAHGYGGESSDLVLRRQGREVDRRPLPYKTDNSDVRLQLSAPADELGWHEYVLEVEPLDGEANLANNVMPVSFEVVRNQIRVLLADGIGRWEYRYLNQLFRREPHIEFDELLFLPEVHGTGALADSPRFPEDADGWARYDVVVLGDVGDRQLPLRSQQALDEYVRKRGGRLIVIAGRDAMPDAYVNQPLLSLLPVEPVAEAMNTNGFALSLTDEGRLHSAMLIEDSPADSRMAWLETYHRFPVYTMSRFCRPKPTARTLLEAIPRRAAVAASRAVDRPDYAFLSWHRIGAGRVAYLAAPETFRLRFRRGDRMHHRFWGQMLRWITAAEAGAGTDQVRIQTDRTHYAAGENVDVTVWLKDTSGRPLPGETVTAEAKTLAGSVASIELTPDSEVAGRYYGTLSALPAGAYQIVPTGTAIDDLLPAEGDAPLAQSTITIRATDSIEMLNTQCNLALLEQLAEVTGGQVISPTALGEVLELASVTPQTSEQVQRTPLWNRWTYLFLIFGCLCTEWVVRKATGLV